MLFLNSLSFYASTCKTKLVTAYTENLIVLLILQLFRCDVLMNLILFHLVFPIFSLCLSLFFVLCLHFESCETCE